MGSKVFFHFGLPRTASTNFQHNIFPELEDYLFVCAPYTQESLAFNKLQYADNILFNQGELTGAIADIGRQYPGRNVLISDENFFGSPNANFMNRTSIAERLAASCPDAELIVFIRGQRNLIQSLYNQFVKSGSYSKDMGRDFISSPGQGLTWQQYTRTPPKWTRELRYLDYQSWMSIEHFFYDEILDFYKSLFARVHVILYEDFFEDGAKVMAELERILGARFSQRAYASLSRPTENSSLSPKELRAKIMGNRIKVVFPSVPVLASRKLLRLIASHGGSGYGKSIEKYLSLLVSDQELTERNIIANEKHLLGMERFPEVYFPAR